jgi:glycosyltransferase involved in cell wall biosynthesis
VHVLWLIKGLGPGGAERLLVNQAAVRSAGIEYEAAYLIPTKDQLAAELEALGVRVECYRAARSWDLRWLVRLRRRLTRGDVDVVHVHSPLVAGFARLVTRSIPRAVRPALAYTEHNRWAQYTRGTRALNRWTYSLDDWQVAVSNGVRDSIRPGARGRVETIVHGIDREAVAALRPERDTVRRGWGIADDTVVAGTVANLRTEKAYPDLVAAARELPPELPIVVIAIGQGPLEDEIRRLVAATELGGRFRLLGYQPDAARLMTGFDIFVLASHHEGLPVSLMEAQALGLPVVATSVGGVPEIVEDGVTGRLVPPGRPDLLAAAVTDVARDREGRATMSKAAVVASERFEMRPAAERLEAGYRRLAAARSERA